MIEPSPMPIDSRYRSGSKNPVATMIQRRRYTITLRSTSNHARPTRSGGDSVTQLPPVVVTRPEHAEGGKGEQVTDVSGRGPRCHRAQRQHPTQVNPV